MFRPFQQLFSALRHFLLTGWEVLRYAPQGKRLAERNHQLEQEMAALRQTEKAMREQHHHVQQAMQSGGIETWIWDHRADAVTYPDTDPVIAATYVRHYQDFLEKVFPDYREAVQRAIETSLAEGNDYEVEYCYLALDGTSEWYYMNGHAYRDETGAVVGLRGMTFDITKRKEAEDALRTREEAARNFQEQLKTLHEMNVQLTQAETLEALYRMAVELGRSKLGFDRIGIFLTDEQQQAMIGTFATTAQGDTRDLRHLRLPIQDGSLIQETMQVRGRISYGQNVALYDDEVEVGRGWQALAMLWNGQAAIGWVSADNLIQQQPLRDEQLELLSLYGTMLGHLIVQKQIETDLRRHQQRLQLALQAGKLRVWDWTRANDQVSYHERPLPEDDAWLEAATSNMDTIFPDDRPKVQAAMRRCIEENVAVNVEFRVWQGDEAKPLWVSSLGHPYHDENGAVIGVIGVSQDITERKESQKQALELALQKERMSLLTEFMSNISHDLKTPLALINTSLYLLERLDDPNKRAEKIHNIRSQVVILDKFIQDILTMSRLDYEPGVMFRPLDISDMLMAVHARLRLAAETKGLTLTMERDEHLPLIVGDASELDRVLANLVENAINYTPTGGQVAVRTWGNKQSHLCIEITDTGIGIAAEDRDKIFSRFYRSQAARTTLASGTGLGLAIVKRIVELHHGEIEVESEVGKGSTFRLKLPIFKR